MQNFSHQMDGRTQGTTIQLTIIYKYIIYKYPWTSTPGKNFHWSIYMTVTMCTLMLYEKIFWL